MGVLADIYVSSPKRAVDYDSDPKPFQNESASWKQFTELEMSMLWAALQSREWDVDLMDRFEKVMVKDGGERLITRLPDELLYDVLAADDAQRDRVLREWSASEELSCDVEEVRPFWDDLKRLSDVAVTSGRGVFLWNCV
jgi:hypothetical protein